MEYQRVHILDLLDEIGEGALYEFLSYFSCLTQEVSDFLHKQYGYTIFDQRDVFLSEGEKRLLHQLFRKI